MQNRRVNIMHVYRLLHRLETEIVGGTISGAAFDRAAGQPHRKAEWIVVATFLQDTAASAHFAHRGAAKLGATDDERIFPESAGL